jgi:hypothetical protein
MMDKKTSYEELKQRVKELEQEAEKHKLADVASEGIIVANISETLRLKDGQAIPWEKGLDIA